jgi:hypothetical protein
MIVASAPKHLGGAAPGLVVASPQPATVRSTAAAATPGPAEERARRCFDESSGTETRSNIAASSDETSNEQCDSDQAALWQRLYDCGEASR